MNEYKNEFYQQEYYQNNKERLLAYKKKYYETHKNEYREAKRKRNTHSVVTTISDELFSALTIKAELEGKAKAAIIQEALLEYLTK